ncbi:MAG: tetratricopeptide repeat protein [Bdellovibrionia bacterium]
MWLWPSMRRILLPSFSLIAFLIFILPCNLSYSAPTSLGPTSQEEAEILWQDGQTSYAEDRFQDAINQLGRYVDRYPGRVGYLEAHFLLGKSYFGLKKFKEALKSFQYYVTSKGINPTSAEANVWVGRSYLELRKFQEALQVAIELDQLQALPPEVVLWKLLIKSRALVGLRHEVKASNTIELAEHEISESTSKALVGQIYSLKLQAKALSCARLQAVVPLEEIQALSLTERRGTCLLETLLTFNKILKTDDPASAADAATYLNQAFDAYRKACIHPPLPKPIPGHPRTAKQLKTYRAELSELLLKNYRENALHGSELLNSWKPPTSSPTYASFLRVASRLKNPNSRTP